MKIKFTKRQLRHRRLRSKVVGTSIKPRLSVFRSNKFLYAQLIDDGAQKTLCAFNISMNSTGKNAKPVSLMKQAVLVGEGIAKAALAAKISAVVFDRGGFAYAGAIKALAETARKNGLKF